MDIRKAQTCHISLRPATASNLLWWSLRCEAQLQYRLDIAHIISSEVAVRVRNWANMFAFFTECGSKLAISLTRTKKIENYLGCKHKNAFPECHLPRSLTRNALRFWGKRKPLVTRHVWGWMRWMSIIYTLTSAWRGCQVLVRVLLSDLLTITSIYDEWRVVCISEISARHFGNKHEALRE